MSYDVPQAVVSGIVLTTFDKIIAEKSLTWAAINGGILTSLDLLVQALDSTKMFSGRTRNFLYKQQFPLVVAFLYAIVQEVMFYFNKRKIRLYDSMLKDMFANLFLASGSASLGKEISKALGFTPSSVNLFTLLGSDSSVNASVSVSVDNRLSQPADNSSMQDVVI